MGFVVKKLLGGLLMPLPLCLAVGVAGWVLWTRGRRRRVGQTLVALSLGMLVLLSLGPVAATVAHAVEGGYAAFPGDSVAFVVVLGNGHVSDPTLPPSALLSEQALYRLVEGLRIAHAQPWATLVLSGWGDADPSSNAQVYQDVAASLGFPRERTVLEPRPRDTAEEARLLAPLLAGHPFALVTSSTHMPRAVALFRGQGLDPIPAPTGHLFKRSPGATALLDDLIPGEDNLAVSRRAWHEVLGRAWARMRGLD